MSLDMDMTAAAEHLSRAVRRDLGVLAFPMLLDLPHISPLRISHDTLHT